MRAALAKLAREPVRKGWPNLASVLWQLAVAEGDVSRAAATLCDRYPVMGEPAVSTSAVGYALLAGATGFHGREELPPPSAEEFERYDVALAWAMRHCTHRFDHAVLFGFGVVDGRAQCRDCGRWVSVG